MTYRVHYCWQQFHHLTWCYRLTDHYQHFQEVHRHFHYIHMVDESENFCKNFWKFLKNFHCFLKLPWNLLDRCSQLLNHRNRVEVECSYFFGKAGQRIFLKFDLRVFSSNYDFEKWVRKLKEKEIYRDLFWKLDQTTKKFDVRDIVLWI